MAKRKTQRTSVDAIRHKDKRSNIPTEELRDFVAEDEQQPKTMLYPRDPSLDPQLVWKGKDEQDAADLAVPVVPVYIQEKIRPQAIIDDLIRQTKKGGTGVSPVSQQLNLFADFNGIEEFDKRVEFYEHQANWSNRMILGDSLMVMTSLAEKEGLKGKVQMIYLDPPYGIKFASNWQVSTRKRDVKDGKAEDTTRQPEQIRAFRDTWKLGIHSYLAYLRDRLVVARELLTETGSVFVQIGDENVHLVRSLVDEVLGAENFCAEIIFKKTTSASTDLLSGVVDAVLWYAKRKECVKYRQLYFEKTIGGPGSGQYTWLEEPGGNRRRATKEELASRRPNVRFLRADQLTSQRPRQGSDVGEFTFEGRPFTPGKGTFKTDLKGLKALHSARRLLAIGDTLSYVRFIDDFPAFPISNLWDDTVTSGFADPKTYVVQTHTKVVERCLLMTTDPGDLVLDPTCGSGTTAYVAEQWGRRWITIDTSRVALALARTRMMAARYPYYLLADSPEGIEKEAEISGTGILPVKHRQDADATSDAAWDANHGEIAKRHGAYLPHWTAEGAIYSITFRLADSLPRTTLEGFLRERQGIVRRAEAAGRPLTAREEKRLRALFSEKVEAFLDAGHGECVLRDERVAVIVRNALAHFDGQRYAVCAWCVMPNHVHVILRPHPGHELSAILHSWKSFTSNQINELLGRSASLWQAEYFDHLIRDADDFEKSVEYVLSNPEAAGLKAWPWCGTAFQAVSNPGQNAPATLHGQDARATEGDIRKGFVYKRVPHVTLKSIANNPDIKEDMTRAEIDAAIARHADTEILYDQPYPDNKRIRVSGPFTVESLSPHRVLSTADENLNGTVTEQEARRQQDFATMILDNLRKAGVQNTVKNERMKFDTLEPLAGRWLHAAGEYTEGGAGVSPANDTGGTPVPPRVRRVAISLGPEHGTVGPAQVKEAAKEAVQGVGYDVLVVCGFAFDPHVSEEAKRYGKLTVLPTRMNPDLAMGDELLKKTGAGNLFTVFGEPDVDIRRVPSEPGASATGRRAKGKPAAGEGEMLEVEIKGVDVYDPTTGQIRNSSTDDIACWFIDTAYNGESFFVRHAYFTGADDPYKKLQRALRAQVNEDAWASLNSTTSRPFDRPETGKIAIKVINHYGDEVLKVFDV